MAGSLREASPPVKLPPPRPPVAGRFRRAYKGLCANLPP